jgi:hypothetical protein
MYNLIHGKNPLGTLFLGALDLTEADVGRFRDAWLTERGEVAIYTRNGGGNRGCWHEDAPEWGSPDCKHHTKQAEVDELEEIRDGVLVRHKKTGRRVMEDRYVCEAPDSPACACVGCITRFRLPEHPLYIRDEDDDFDYTYATFYFRMPESLKGIASALAEKRDPDEQWLRAIEDLKQGKRPDVEAALKPVLTAIQGVIRDA